MLSLVVEYIGNVFSMSLIVKLCVVTTWLGVVWMQPDPLTLIQDYFAFTFLGVVGAIFANATGAGGGVVFMPFFNQLDFSVTTSVATSFAIQCCGMTAGAITWFSHYRQLQSDTSNLGKVPDPGYWQSLHKIVAITVPFSLLGVWSVQFAPQFFAHISDPNSLHTGFGVFSILLALAIFATVLFNKVKPIRSQLTVADTIAIGCIGYCGGGITGWLSIGVGELLAVYLIVRGFNVTFSIAVAVIVSAFTVWGGVIFHLVVTQAVYWPVVIFAGLGAVLGGILARRLVLHFSVKKLKLFFAAWILVLGITALPV